MDSGTPLSNGSAATNASAEQRRAWDRYVSSRPLPRSLCVADTQIVLDAWILDLSAGGIGLLVEQYVSVGTRLEIELETCPKAPPLKRVVAVSFCRAEPNGEFRLGCHFTKPLRESDIAHLQD